MSRKLSPKSVEIAVRGTAFQAVYGAVYGAVGSAVWVAVGAAVWGAVWRTEEEAVSWAVDGAVHLGPPHPNLQRFIGEIRQTRARWDAA